MPRTFLLTEKRQIDGQLWPEGTKVTTSKFDGVKSEEIPEDLKEVKGAAAAADSVQSPEKASVASPSGAVFTEEELEKMDVPELKAIAAELRIDNANRMSKAESLILAITDMQKSNETLQDPSTADGTGLATPAKSSSDVTPV